MKSCIIFDVDGTLFDTRDGIIQALNYVLKIYGRSKIKKKDEAKYIGPPIKKSLMEFQDMEESEAKEATSLYRKSYVEKFIGNSVWYDSVVETLIALKEKGAVLGIATMKTMPQMEALIQNFQYDNLFSVLKVAREDGSLSKAMMLKDIKKEYPEVEKFVMVGDTMGDLNAAKEAGYEFVAADYGYGDISRIDTKHISSFFELQEIEFT